MRKVILVFISIIFINNSFALEYCTRLQEAKKDHSFYLGALVMAAPEYKGSKKYIFIPVPNFMYNYGKTLTISPYHGIKYTEFSLCPVNFDLGVKYKFWLRGKRDEVFKNIENIKPYAEGYIVAKTGYKGIALSIGVYAPIGNNKAGYFSEANLMYFMRITKKINLFTGVGGTYSGKTQMQLLYGVKKEQASTEIKEYQISSGFDEIKFNLGGNYAISERWNLHAMIAVKNIIGDAAKSPLIKHAWQLFANISINYKF